MVNTQKVIVGGIAAGVVMGAIDAIVSGVLLAEQSEAALNALNPDLAANLEGAGVVVFGIASALLFGLLVAWTYASMRPRYGAGSRTAMFAALQMWCVLTLVAASMSFIGMFTWGLFAVGAVVTAVELLVGANVAGFLYREQTAG